MLTKSSGPVASTYAGRRGDLPKPVVAAFILNPEVQGIPLGTDDQNPDKIRRLVPC